MNIYDRRRSKMAPVNKRVSEQEGGREREGRILGSGAASPSQRRIQSGEGCH